MGIFDNVKGKLSDKVGSIRNRDDWDDEYDEYDEWEDGYEDDEYYEDDYEDDYDRRDRRESDRNSTTGSWRNRDDSPIPLVSSADVRASRALDDRMREPVSGSPDYETSIQQNYKIEPRDGIGRSSGHSPEFLNAARDELDQLSRGIPVPLNSMAGAGQQGRAGATPSTVSRRIVTVVPTSYEDAAQIADAFRAGSSVAISLVALKPDLARRLLDFSFGVVSVSEGKVERVGERAFFLSHNGAPITDSERQQLAEAGVL